MDIIGWIRIGDKAACGGVVIEGDQTCISHGKPYAFQGSHLACQKNCTIMEGFSRSTLTNGRSKVIHGMMTSGGCPILSTLNDLDGVGNASRARFFLNAEQCWIGSTPVSGELPHDERVKLALHHVEGTHYFIETNDGRKFSGRAAADGLLPRIDTFGEDEYTLLWGDEALNKISEEMANG